MAHILFCWKIRRILDQIISQHDKHLICTLSFICIFLLHLLPENYHRTNKGFIYFNIKSIEVVEFWFYLLLWYFYLHTISAVHFVLQWNPVKFERLNYKYYKIAFFFTRILHNAANISTEAPTSTIVKGMNRQWKQAQPHCSTSPLCCSPVSCRNWCMECKSMM